MGKELQGDCSLRGQGCCPPDRLCDPVLGPGRPGRRGARPLLQGWRSPIPVGRRQVPRETLCRDPRTSCSVCGLHVGFVALVSISVIFVAARLPPLLDSERPSHVPFRSQATGTVTSVLPPLGASSCSLVAWGLGSRLVIWLLLVLHVAMPPFLFFLN